MNVALIPARAGSKRLPNKNIKLLNGRPLLSYSVISAIESGLFAEVIVSTDSEEIAAVAKNYRWSHIPWSFKGKSRTNLFFANCRNQLGRDSWAASHSIALSKFQIFPWIGQLLRTTK